MLEAHNNNTSGNTYDSICQITFRHDAKHTQNTQMLFNHIYNICLNTTFIMRFYNIKKTKMIKLCATISAV